MKKPENGSWRALVKADCDRNLGLPLELMGAEGYAERDGVTREQYVIRVLRAERERRQAEDAITRDAAMLDGIIDAARGKGVPVMNYVLQDLAPKLGRQRTWDISPDFLAKLVTRLEERQAEGRQGG